MKQNQAWKVAGARSKWAGVGMGAMWLVMSVASSADGVKANRESQEVKGVKREDLARFSAALPGLGSGEETRFYGWLEGKEKFMMGFKSAPNDRGILLDAGNQILHGRLRKLDMANRQVFWQVLEQEDELQPLSDLMLGRKDEETAEDGPGKSEAPRPVRQEEGKQGEDEEEEEAEASRGDEEAVRVKRESGWKPMDEEWTLPLDVFRKVELPQAPSRRVILPEPGEQYVELSDGQVVLGRVVGVDAGKVVIERLGQRWEVAARRVVRVRTGLPGVVERETPVAKEFWKNVLIEKVVDSHWKPWGDGVETFRNGMVSGHVGKVAPDSGVYLRWYEDAGSGDGALGAFFSSRATIGALKLLPVEANGRGAESGSPQEIQPQNIMEALVNAIGMIRTNGVEVGFFGKSGEDHFAHTDENSGVWEEMPDGELRRRDFEDGDGVNWLVLPGQKSVREAKVQLLTRDWRKYHYPARNAVCVEVYLDRVNRQLVLARDGVRTAMYWLPPRYADGIFADLSVSVVAFNDDQENSVGVHGFCMGEWTPRRLNREPESLPPNSLVKGDEAMRGLYGKGGLLEQRDILDTGKAVAMTEEKNEEDDHGKLADNWSLEGSERTTKNLLDELARTAALEPYQRKIEALTGYPLYSESDYEEGKEDLAMASVLEPGEKGRLRLLDGRVLEVETLTWEGKGKGGKVKIETTGGGREEVSAREVLEWVTGRMAAAGEGIPEGKGRIRMRNGEVLDVVTIRAVEMEQALPPTGTPAGYMETKRGFDFAGEFGNWRQPATMVGVVEWK